MDLHTLTFTFSQSKKLKELGVDEHSLYYHYAIHDPDPELKEPYSLILRPKDFDEDEKYPAYTSAEIGEIIKNTIVEFCQYTYKDKENTIDLHWDEKEICQRYENLSEAQARAEFLIYLLENK